MIQVWLQINIASPATAACSTTANGNSVVEGRCCVCVCACLCCADAAPAGFDHAGASRVLLSAQQTLRQLQTASAAQPTLQSSTDDSSSSAVSTIDELDEAESSMAEDAIEEGASGHSAGGSPSSRHNLRRDASFDAAWQVQLKKPGLLGALIAAAYPDRIAQLKPGTGGKPSYTLSTGGQRPLTSQGLLAAGGSQAQAVCW